MLLPFFIGKLMIKSRVLNLEVTAMHSAGDSSMFCCNLWHRTVSYTPSSSFKLDLQLVFFHIQQYSAFPTITSIRKTKSCISGPGKCGPPSGPKTHGWRWHNVGGFLRDLLTLGDNVGGYVTWGLNMAPSMISMFDKPCIQKPFFEIGKMTLTLN